METEVALLAVAGVLIVVALAWAAPRIGVAAPVLLVLVGAACSYVPGAPELVVEPEVILTLVLPPILYATAVNVPTTDLRRNLRTITALSVVLVVVSAVVVGLVLHALLPDLGLAAAIALGAVVSPPDAVAATSIGKRLGLPPRLLTVLEGEGLVNDATALVLLRTAVAATAGAVSFGQVAGDFGYAVVVAVVVGFVVGQVAMQVRARLDQPVLTTAISLTVPFVAFIPAEHLDASGVLATVVAGLVTGAGSARHLRAQDRISERVNWRTIQLLLENGVFLVMGFELRALVDDVESQHLSVGQAVGVGLATVGVLVVVRVLFVVPLVASLRRERRRAVATTPRIEDALERVAELSRSGARDAVRLRRAGRMLRGRHADAQFLATEGLGWRGGAVIAWSGMRGVVTLAAAQTLPHGVPYRPQLVLVAFTVALVTLVVQGGTLPQLIRVLGVSGSRPEAEAREAVRLVDEVLGAARAALESPELRRSDGRPFDPEVVAETQRKVDELAVAMAVGRDPGVVETHLQRRELRRTVLEAAQAALLDARASATYSSRTLERAQRALDAEVQRLEGDGDEH